jgi:uncharacterized membrane protein
MSAGSTSDRLGARRWMAALLLVAVAGTAAHFLTIVAIPKIVMGQVLKKIAAQDSWNVLRHPKPADETERVVVMPSPDLLYSICAYDLSKGPLELKTELPPGTLWSLTAYDAWTNNYFTDDDRRVSAPQRHYVIALEEHAPQVESMAMDDSHLHLIYSSTTRGLLLIRTVINQEQRLGELDAIRRKASCAPLPVSAPAKT